MVNSGGMVALKLRPTAGGLGRLGRWRQLALRHPPNPRSPHTRATTLSLPHTLSGGCALPLPCGGQPGAPVRSVGPV